MNTTRRGFLGSILGTYVATQLPWYARLASTASRDTPFSWLTATVDDLRRCKSNLILEDGTIIKGPTIQEVAKPGTLIKSFHSLLKAGEDDSFRFVFSPVEATRRFTVQGIQLVDPWGNLLISNPFQEGCHTVLPGDNLHPLQRVTIDVV